MNVDEVRRKLAQMGRPRFDRHAKNFLAAYRAAKGLPDEQGAALLRDLVIKQLGEIEGFAAVLGALEEV